MAKKHSTVAPATPLSAANDPTSMLEMPELPDGLMPLLLQSNIAARMFAHIATDYPGKFDDADYGALFGLIADTIERAMDAAEGSEAANV